jgi:hypothetical protein
VTDDLLPGEDIAAWGARTGRYQADQIPFWRAQIEQERRRVFASGGDPYRGSNAVEATIRILHPALPPITTTTVVTASAAGGLTDDEYAAMFPTDRPVSASSADEAEYRALYGDQKG